MTERPASALRRSDNRIVIGPSSAAWDGGSLLIDLCEVGAPWPSRVRGRLRVTPEAIFDQAYALDAGGLHQWRPIAPRARIEVEMQRPALCWSGAAYCDMNFGEEPIEDAFVDWDWSRSDAADATYVFYDARAQDGAAREISLRFKGGRVDSIIAPARVTLRRSGWGVARATRSSASAKIEETLEDTPFYARSIISSQFDGMALRGVHESLSLRRFRLPIVQAMLPFRMPRAPR